MVASQGNAAMDEVPQNYEEARKVLETRGGFSSIKIGHCSVCSRKGALNVWNWETRTYTPFPDGRTITLPAEG